jgi:hypothetical protein
VLYSISIVLYGISIVLYSISIVLYNINDLQCPNATTIIFFPSVELNSFSVFLHACHNIVTVHDKNYRS